MYGHQLLLPGPRHRPHRALPGLRRQPDGLQRQPDDGAGLPGPAARAQGPRRPDGGASTRAAPRPPRSPHEHHFVRPGTDALVLLAMLHVLFDEGLTTPPAYVDGLDAVREAVAAVHPGARRSRPAASPPTSSAAWRASSPRRESAAVYGRVGVSTQEFGLVATWAVQLLNLRHRQPRPARRRDAHPPGGRRRRPRAGRHAATTTCGAAGSAACRSSAASCRSRRWPTRSSPRARARCGRCSRWPATRSPPPPTAQRLDEALAGLDFVAAVDLYVNETTRHADVILPPTVGAGARPLRPGLPRRSRCATPPGSPPRCSTKPEGAMHDWEIYREIVLRTQRLLAAQAAAARRRLVQAGPDAGLPDPDHRPAAAHRPGPAVGAPAAAAARSTSAPLEPCLPERLMTPGQPDRTRRRRRCSTTWPGSTRPRSHADGLLLVGRRHQRDNNSWMHNTPRLTKGRARHQLCMHPDDLAARGIADGAVVRVASAVGAVEVEVQASDDMMPGVVQPAARLRPPARRRPAAARRRAARRVDERPDRPRGARRQRQRRALRRAGDGHAGRLTGSGPARTARTASRAAIGSTAAEGGLGGLLADVHGDRGRAARPPAVRRPAPSTAT